MIINIPTLAESHLLKQIAKLKSEVYQLKVKVKDAIKAKRILESENVKLRKASGQPRKLKKLVCMQNYTDGMSGSQLAEVSGCSPRYANIVIAAIKAK